jgi:N-methylhydantoinase B
MYGKGKQFVPHDERVILGLPGGAGYGPASDRDPALIKRDLARGYISAKAAADDYGLSQAEIDAVLLTVTKGESA